jgi:hypothetical protein
LQVFSPYQLLPIHLRKNLVNHRPNFPITELVHLGQHPSLESAVSGVINAWLKKYTDPTSSCLPHYRAVLHILRLRVTHITSHTVGKGPQGPFEEILQTQEAIFQFRLLLDTNLPTTRTAPSSSSKSSLSSASTSANKESA